MHPCSEGTGFVAGMCVYVQTQYLTPFAEPTLSDEPRRRLRTTARMGCFAQSCPPPAAALLIWLYNFSQFIVDWKRLHQAGAPTVYDIVGLVRLVPRLQLHKGRFGRNQNKSRVQWEQNNTLAWKSTVVKPPLSCQMN